MKTIRAPTVCPACQFPNDAHTAAEGTHTPAEGDYAICFYCAYVGIFTFSNGNLAVRRPTEDEVTAMQGNPKLAAVLAVIGKRQ